MNQFCFLTGTKSWKYTVHTCNGKKQSPVDIITALTFNKNLGPIDIVNYDESSAQILLTNTGTTGELDYSCYYRETLNFSLKMFLQVLLIVKV